MKRTLITALTIATLVASMVACTPRDAYTASCLASGAPVYDVPPTHTTPFPYYDILLANGTTVDARGETFVNDVLTGTGHSQGMKVHKIAGSRDRLCLVGGEIETNFDPENTSWLTWHKITGMHVVVDNFTVVGTSLRNEGDGIAFVGAQNWKVIGVRVDGGGRLPGGYIHDDCVENDGMANGAVDDSKFDGCNIFMSSDSTADGGDNTVHVSNTLVRLRPFRNNYNADRYGENTHGGFFKFVNPIQTIDPGTPPHLVVKNSVFRADQPGVFGGNANGFLALPPGSECDNVMLVGAAAWQARDRASWENQCTNLTYGTDADWNARVAAWDAAHPEL